MRYDKWKPSSIRVFILFFVLSTYFELVHCSSHSPFSDGMQWKICIYGNCATHRWIVWCESNAISIKPALAQTHTHTFANAFCFSTKNNFSPLHVFFLPCRLKALLASLLPLDAAGMNKGNQYIEAHKRIQKDDMLSMWRVCLLDFYVKGCWPISHLMYCSLQIVVGCWGKTTEWCFNTRVTLVYHHAFHGISSSVRYEFLLFGKRTEIKSEMR